MAILRTKIDTALKPPLLIYFALKIDFKTAHSSRSNHEQFCTTAIFMNGHFIGRV